MNNRSCAPSPLPGTLPMSSTARQRILTRLHAAPSLPAPAGDPAGQWQAPNLDPSQCVALLKRRMEAVRTEVHAVPEAGWPAALAEVLHARTLDTLAYGPGAWFAEPLQALLKHPGMPAPLPYAESVETFRDTLFAAGAAVTSAVGAIAETGALILWPDAAEPRLLSLVPPVHIVLLYARDIHPTFARAITALNWSHNQPANALLISGPSKTADIELVLAFGVHGPKELVVLVLE